MDNDAIMVKNKLHKLKTFPEEWEKITFKLKKSGYNLSKINLITLGK